MGSWCESYLRVSYEMLTGSPVLKHPQKRNPRAVVGRAVAVPADKNKGRLNDLDRLRKRKNTSRNKLVEKRRKNSPAGYTRSNG